MTASAQHRGPGTPIEVLMGPSVICVSPDDPISRARQLMLGLRHHGLPVVDREGMVVGIITSSDLVEQWPTLEPVETAMSRPVLTIDLRASAAEAAILMFEAGVHHLVVTRDERPVGVVSSFDLLQALIPPKTTPGAHQADRS